MEERVTLERAWELIDLNVKPLDIEPVEIMFSEGRVLAERVMSWVDLPGADSSKLDGYALRSGDVPPGGADLEVVGAAMAAEPYEGDVPFGSCVKIATGAIVPKDLDAVVAEEDVDEKEGKVRVSGPVSGGQGVRPRSEEMHVGMGVANPGEVMTPGRISLLIAAGWVEARYVKQPRARVIATGDELKSPGSALEPGDVYPSAAAGVVAWCRAMGMSDVRLSLVADHPYDVQDAFPDEYGADLVVTIGGTGRGERDVVMKALDALGVEILFRGIKIRPGHQATFGTLAGVPVLCLPGGPSACDVTFQVLARRVVSALKGIPERGLPYRLSTLSEDVKSRDEEDHLVRVKLECLEMENVATPYFSPKAHLEIAGSHGIVRAPAGQDLKAGQKVKVWLSGEGLRGG